MANTMVANVGSVIALVLALLWVITLTVPWNWLWSQNPIVMFKVNLFSLYVAKGLAGHVASAVISSFSKKYGASLNSLLNRNMWLEEGVQNLCMPGVDTVWNWCNTWTMVKYGSFMMVFLGFLAAALLAAGGAFMYYYTHQHATHTGRMWIRTCFIGGPGCAVLGVLQYMMLTFQMGRGDRALLQTSANYGPGFITALALTLFSFIPLYIHGVFSKVDDHEKYGESGDARQVELTAAFGNAPQAGMPPPYGAYGPTDQSMMPPPAYGAPYGAAAGPPGQPFPPGAPGAPPMPGSGAPAW